MYTIVWAYTVKSDRIAAFQRAYAADGTWAQLFRHAEGYIGTDLFQNPANPAVFLTLDRWTDETAFARFRAAQADAYKELDVLCEGLTEKEQRLGAFPD